MESTVCTMFFGVFLCRFIFCGVCSKQPLKLSRVPEGWGQSLCLNGVFNVELVSGRHGKEAPNLNDQIVAMRNSELAAGGQVGVAPAFQLSAVEETGRSRQPFHSWGSLGVRQVGGYGIAACCRPVIAPFDMIAQLTLFHGEGCKKREPP